VTTTVRAWDEAYGIETGHRALLDWIGQWISR
jgi:hypothetical protein